MTLRSRLRKRLRRGSECGLVWTAVAATQRSSLLTRARLREPAMKNHVGGLRAPDVSCGFVRIAVGAKRPVLRGESGGRGAASSNPRAQCTGALWNGGEVHLRQLPGHLIRCRKLEYARGGRPRPSRMKGVCVLRKCRSVLCNGAVGGNSRVSSLQVRRLNDPTSVGVVGCAAGAKRWRQCRERGSGSAWWRDLVIGDRGRAMRACVRERSMCENMCSGGRAPGRTRLGFGFSPGPSSCCLCVDGGEERRVGSLGACAGDGGAQRNCRRL